MPYSKPGTLQSALSTPVAPLPTANTKRYIDGAFKTTFISAGKANNLPVRIVLVVSAAVDSNL